MTFTPTEPSRQVLAAQQFARWALLTYIQHLETDSVVGAARMRLFSAAVERSERIFPSLRLDADVLLGEGYCSLPFVWGLERMEADGPVTAERVWARVLRHLNEDTGAREILNMDLSRPIEPSQISAIQVLTDGFEDALTQMVLIDPGVSIIAGYASKEQEKQLLGHGGYPGEEESALLVALRSDRNPLPRWEVALGDGTFFVFVVPDALRVPVEQWFVIRAYEIGCYGTALPFMVDQPSPEDHESILVAIGLMASGLSNGRGDVGGTVMGILDYVKHSLLLPDAED